MTARTDYTGEGKYHPIAQGLNRLGLWVNGFRAAPPLTLRTQPDGLAVALGVNVPALASSVLALLAHPWQLIVSSTGYQIRGGNLLTGTGVVAVAGIDSAGTADRKFWLYLKYPNDTSSPTAEIREGSTLPDNAYEVDALPGDPMCDAVVLDGWCEIIVPLAAISAGLAVQYQYSDLDIPRGKTITITRVIDHFWDGGTLKHAMVTETYVNGILRTVTGPSCKEVFLTDACPA